jgi:hypothetical protein
LEHARGERTPWTAGDGTLRFGVMEDDTTPPPPPPPPLAGLISEREGNGGSRDIGVPGWDACQYVCQFQGPACPSRYAALSWSEEKGGFDFVEAGAAAGRQALPSHGPQTEHDISWDSSAGFPATWCVPILLCMVTAARCHSWAAWASVHHRSDASSQAYPTLIPGNVPRAKNGGHGVAVL